MVFFCVVASGEQISVYLTKNFFVVPLLYLTMFIPCCKSGSRWP